MRIYFLRHGESEGNRENRFRGRMDYPLTERGIYQAENAGRYLKGGHFEKIYSSPLKRAVTTAERISHTLDSDFELCDAFNNIKLGEWEGKKKDYIEKHYPKQFNTWLTRPHKLRMENMESLPEIEKRVLEKIASLMRIHSGNIIIVTHRTVIKPAIAALIGISEPSFWKIEVDTASISIIECSNGQWTLKNLNINHYLDDYPQDVQ